MWNTLRRLALGIFLIAVASGILLWRDSSEARGPRDKPRIAILQHASTPVLDAGVRGMIDGLAEKGWRDGETCTIRKFNAENDVSIANSIALEIVNGPYDLVLTSSTPSMQALANANRAGRVIQVFGLVADPFSAGVGLKRDNPGDHPRHLVGLGSMVPIGQTIRMARQLNPNLKRIGMVWNPGESNSQATMQMARAVCKEDGLELLEANAENTSAVAEACDSLVARGAQVIAVGGDNTVSAAINVLIDAARKGGIPVVTSLPDKPDRGTLLDLGTDFYECGKLSGLLAGDILNGTDPATVPVRDAADVVRHHIYVNEMVPAGLKERWQIPPEILKNADVVVNQSGIHRRDKK
jgi:ABC-type uncharacterized transport system substrate-binding protein